MSWRLNWSCSDVPGPSQIIPQSFEPVWDSSCVLTLAELWTLNILCFPRVEVQVWGADSNLEWIRPVTQLTSCWEKPKCSSVFTCESAFRLLGCRLIDLCLTPDLNTYSLCLKHSACKLFTRPEHTCGYIRYFWTIFPRMSLFTTDGC